MFNTQSSSEKRVQKDALGNTALIQLFSNYSNLEIEPFRKYCQELILQGTGTKAKKVSFIFDLQEKCTSKDRMLQKTQNYILAGMGLGA